MAKQKKRKKARSPYQTYKYWYNQYAKNNVMKYDLFSRKDFQEAYDQLRLQGASNPAKTVAQGSLKYSAAQTRNYKRVIRRFTDKKIDLKGADFEQKLIQIVINSEDPKTGERKYFDKLFYMSLGNQDKIEYMKDVVSRVRSDINGKTLRDQKGQIASQNSFGNIVKVLHDIYKLTYQEIFSPKET